MSTKSSPSVEILRYVAEVKEAPKTSNAPPMCIQILERGAPSRKSKYLAEQAFFENCLRDGKPVPYGMY